MQSSGRSILVDRWYTGQYSYTDDFGLMFYNARWYDSYLNHFTQPDSIVPDPYNSQDWNRYAYAQNNPLRYTDPTGHVTCEGANWDDGPQCVSKNSKQYNIDKHPENFTPLDLAIRLNKRNGENGGTLYWAGLTDAQQDVLQSGGWTEGSYNDLVDGGVSDADFWHDPLTYIEMLVGAGGALRSGYNLLVGYATINGGAGLVSLGSNGMYQKTGFTYFQLPESVYNTLNKLGLARLINASVINNQIAQGKPMIVSLWNPSQPGPGTAMEIEMLNNAQYIKTTANWLGANWIFQPPVWKWLP